MKIINNKITVFLLLASVADVLNANDVALTPEISNLKQAVPASKSNAAKPLVKFEEKSDNLDSLSKLKSIDKTLAVIYHTEGTSVILLSDLKPSLDGNPKTLDGVIFERLMLLEAQKFKITVNEGEIDRYLAQLQKENQLSRDDVIKLFKKSGYTYKEGREQLKNLRIIGILLDEKVKNKVLIQQKDIEAYYKANENKYKKEASYKLSQALIPCALDNRAIKRISINQAIESGDMKDSVTWGTPIELKDSEIAAKKSEIQNLSEGSIIILEENNEGFVLVNLIKKHEQGIIPLEEASKEIGNTLGKDKFEKAMKSYQEKLISGAKIKYHMA